MNTEVSGDIQCLHPVLISVSSNCGDRIKNCQDALAWLTSVLKNAVMSSVYETEDISSKKENSGKMDGDSSATLQAKPKYMNAVISGYTDIPFETFNANLKAYEWKHGRDSEARRKGEVPIDLDIVKWNGNIIRPRDYAADYFRKGLAEIEQG